MVYIYGLAIIPHGRDSPRGAPASDAEVDGEGRNARRTNPERKEEGKAWQTDKVRSSR
jgi:hypothetical protein